MATLEKVEQLISEMTSDEKVKLIQWIARDLGSAFPGIESTLGICGGEPRIAGSRIPVWTLVQFRKLGGSEEDLLGAYPTLDSDDLANAWAYYLSHKDEIEQQITENENA